MIEFYGSPQSSSDRTLWMLNESGVAYDYKKPDLRSPEGRAAYRSINPAIKVPYLIDGHVRMAESMAINFYVAENYNRALWAEDTATRAKIYEWTLFAHTNLQPESLKVLRHTRLLAEDKRDPKLAQEGRDNARRFLDVIDGQLKSTWILGGRMTVADINVGSILNVADRAQLALGGRTRDYLSRLRELPSFKKTYAL